MLRQREVKKENYRRGVRNEGGEGNKRRKKERQKERQKRKKERKNERMNE